MNDEVVVGHAFFLFNHNGRFDYFAEAGGVRITCFECLGHHVGRRDKAIMRSDGVHHGFMHRFMREFHHRRYRA